MGESEWVHCLSEWGKLRVEIRIAYDVRSARSILSSTPHIYWIHIRVLLLYWKLKPKVAMVAICSSCHLVLTETTDLTQDASLFQLIPALHAILVPTSYPLLSLLRLQLLRVRPTTSNELAHLDRLYSIAVSSSLQVYPSNHPVLAILHAEWGQILTQTFAGEAQDMVSGRMVKSVELLRKAYDLCQKSFGKDGGIEGNQVAEVLRGLEAEIQMARSTR